MGKIKSAIITVIVTLATLVLFLFGVVSCNLPDGVHRYNSILSNIHLGSELSGDAYTTLLPEGVITAEEYAFTVVEDSDKAAEYEEKYVVSESGAYYVDREVLDSYNAGSDSAAFAALAEDLQSDAEILSSRFGARNYTSYSVSVVDGCAIRVAVPTNFTYAAYTGSDTSSVSDDITYASNAISYLTLGGELTLRNNTGSLGWRDEVTSAQSADEHATTTYNIIDPRYEITDIISSATYYSMGGTYAVKINLTSLGEEILGDATLSISESDDTYLRFYVGETSVINLTCESQLTGRTFYIQAGDEATARNYAAILNSTASGNALTYVYSYDEVIYGTSSSGANAAMFTPIEALVLFFALAVFAVVRYKKLGLVFSLMALLFCSAMIAIIYLVGTTLTLAGIFVALLTLALFAGSNFWAYESVRKETLSGRTVQASVKQGYKNTLSAILEVHIVLLVISVMLALIGVGEVAACGLILLIGTLASYLLYWFARFMWYVTLSPARDKYKFCGFKREAIEDYE